MRTFRRNTLAAVLLCVLILSHAIPAAMAAVNVVVNGSTYSFPQTGDDNWGDNVTQWAQAVSLHTLQKTGGTFTLTADTNFGANFGLVSTYYKSRTANISSAGQVRLANTDTIGWRNAANSGNLLLSVSVSDMLQFNGSDLITAAGAANLTNKTLTSPVIITPTLTGPITPTNNLNFGTAFGIEGVYFSGNNGTSRADSGRVRLNKTDVVAWRNNADSANLNLGINGTDQPLFNGYVLMGVEQNPLNDLSNVIAPTPASGDVLIYNGANWVNSQITNGSVASGAAIARSKLASGTADHVVINDGLGAFSSEAQLALSRGGTGQNLTGHVVLTDLNTVSGIVNKGFTSPAITTKIDLLTQAELRFQDDAGGQYISFGAPTGVSTYAQELPATPPTVSQALLCTGGSPGPCAWSSVVSNPVIGDFTVDSPTFFVDSTNNRVGIGTLTPATTLDVVGSMAVSVNASVSGTLAVAGDVAVDTNVLKVDTANNRVGINKTSPATALDVVGSAAISTNLSVSGTGDIASDLTVDTSTLKVDATNNRVGVGTASPSQLLDVGGMLSSNVIMQDTNERGTETGNVTFSATTGSVITYAPAVSTSVNVQGSTAAGENGQIVWVFKEFGAAGTVTLKHNVGSFPFFNIGGIDLVLGAGTRASGGATYTYLSGGENGAGWYQVSQATKSLSLRYTRATAGTFTSSSTTWNRLDYGTKDYETFPTDTYNGSSFTAPFAGKFKVCACMIMDGVDSGAANISWAIGESAHLSVAKSSAATTTTPYTNMMFWTEHVATTGQGIGLTGCTTVDMAQSDVLSVYFRQNSGQTAIMTTVAASHVLTIDYVGP